MFRHVLFLSSLLALAACSSNPHNAYYREHGTLHPELLEIHKKECLGLGFKDGTTAMAECRKDLAQDWKNNLEARSRDNRPAFGINYGYGFGNHGYGIGSRW